MTLSLLNLQQQREAVADQYLALATAEKDRIMDCQLDSGLIVYSPPESGDPQIVVPYFSSIAAWGLLAGTVTPEQLDSAGRYIQWYLDHLNTWASDPVNGDGTVYDYRVDWKHGGTVERSEEGYDSVDSYAALFLILADRYQQVARDDLLAQREEDLLRVVDALLRTLHSDDGLSHVKEEYPVHYLMDNAEVYAGLKAAFRLLVVLSPQSVQLDRIGSAVAQLERGVESGLWDPDTKSYAVGIMDNGGTMDFQGWQEFYPSSVVQLFPAALGLIPADSDRSRQLYQDFCQAWNWPELEHMTSGASSHFWSFLCYAAARMGDEDSVLEFLDQYQTALAQGTYEKALYTGDMGWTALACGYLEDCYRTLWPLLPARNYADL